MHGPHHLGTSAVQAGSGPVDRAEAQRRFFSFEETYGMASDRPPPG